MKKISLLLLLFIVTSLSLEARLKVLHMTFHKGCKQDFQEVAQELDLDLTTWFVQDLPLNFWEGQSSANEIYNVGPKRAKRVWDRHKDYFNEFDVIVTSDTVPLSTIFLRHGWTKPLIIWICNRFDYAHGRGVEERFPDPAYYNVMRDAATKPNVRFVAYTPYEHLYARQKGVDTGSLTIKPLGKEEQFHEVESTVPASIDKSETVLIFPRLDANKAQRALGECKARSIKAWSGAYNGPEDLKQFKGVVFFPYAFSNLALFENLQRGIVHFVPTQNFLRQLRFIWDPKLSGNLSACEWYDPMYKDVLVFFDSWDDLKHKIDTTDYAGMSQKIRQLGAQHRQEMKEKWQALFQELATE